jgi:hypothetical protein
VSRLGLAFVRRHSQTDLLAVFLLRSVCTCPVLSSLGFCRAATFIFVSDVIGRVTYFMDNPDIVGGI